MKYLKRRDTDRVLCSSFFISHFRIIHDNHAATMAVINSFGSFVVGLLAHRSLVTRPPPHPPESSLSLILHRECVSAPHLWIYFIEVTFSNYPSIPLLRTSCIWRFHPTPNGAQRRFFLFGRHDSQMPPRLPVDLFLRYRFLLLSRP